ncbi:phosphatase PAP2 family protein [Paenibacillus mucilaginosus]|uniref:Membrane-associated phospholipid phosphatase n=3 Tax=Paenibacillus mucilaginosus TaxID=61624 RepID=H6NTD5_9BACL|nr:phosphatase PAP2 family protein [Paenibacillus mucilaginosus]AFC27597.1 membrane-associated phospholipid phosphatase [Paenibacillus mucilaginosus 3016]AFH59752.1 PAP2 family phosphoesterase [Paenibacillus mucilaginosus K02]MCG7216975.1 phosphatase PAP2 family protein [Paenibacillus mucilaginosus]WDM28315.1 phosphatase PAP2 family protein [Paenibacillus mucilaginosus]WFA16488.1 phosphatase PAP2 family protein [Paenibacillus mucilaginosus]
MDRVVSWLVRHERRMFNFVNRRMQHRRLDLFFNGITHLGGATAMIVIALSMAIFGRGSWKLAGLESCIALAVSHIPVAVIKKKYPRLRPYLVLPDTITYKNPLKDHSFPSGHTTAIFSVTVPLMLMSPWCVALLLPIAILVGVSRMYLGLHYPSDCLAGSVIGTGAAFAAAAFIG